MGAKRQRGNGARVMLDVRVNGMPMGSEVQVDGAVRLACRIRTPRLVERIVLFRDGKQVTERRIGRRQVSLTLEDHPDSGDHFYYVEVKLKPLPRTPMGGRRGNLQVAQGDYAWSSPIWVRKT